MGVMKCENCPGWATCVSYLYRSITITPRLSTRVAPVSHRNQVLVQRLVTACRGVLPGTMEFHFLFNPKPQPQPLSARDTIILFCCRCIVHWLENYLHIFVGGTYTLSPLYSTCTMHPTSLLLPAHHQQHHLQRRYSKIRLREPSLMPRYTSASPMPPSMLATGQAR